MIHCCINVAKIYKSRIQERK